MDLTWTKWGTWHSHQRFTLAWCTSIQWSGVCACACTTLVSFSTSRVTFIPFTPWWPAPIHWKQEKDMLGIIYDKWIFIILLLISQISASKIMVITVTTILGPCAIYDIHLKRILKPKSREITFAHYLFRRDPIVLKFCTEHGNDLCTISKWLDKRKGYYGRTRFCVIWV